ncbi:MAG: hypothetical protein HC866_06190 [Leptolyngbyaceae cyanobacterium RU_5_1]|nr:hypothetical protein [Leptolyngbyaceae cyanobacterium RU_5_1]
MSNSQDVLFDLMDAVLLSLLYENGCLASKYKSELRLMCSPTVNLTEHLLHHLLRVRS